MSGGYGLLVELAGVVCVYDERNTRSNWERLSTSVNPVLKTT
jgi:hypothetical protein